VGGRRKPRLIFSASTPGGHPVRGAHRARLLPLTVGLLGDWGSGKSSLMRITRQELLEIRDDEESPSRYVCVEFSPWQHEDYDDVKVALMRTVLDAVGARTVGDQQDQVSRLRRFAQGRERRERSDGQRRIPGLGRHR
jgi:ATPase subunit of ABC transporter with duplicated ATPase domains